MIKGNIIYFGHGTVGVSVICHCLNLIHIEPPQVIGKVINDDAKAVRQINIPFRKLSEIHELRALLSETSRYEHKRFVFKGYVFDFSNYNSDSIEVIRRCLKFIERNLLFVMAC